MYVASSELKILKHVFTKIARLESRNDYRLSPVSCLMIQRIKYKINRRNIRTEVYRKM